MALLNVVSTFSGIPGGPAREWIRGDQTEMAFPFTINGAPPADISQFQFDWVADFYLASVSQSGDSVTINGHEEHATKMQVPITSSVTGNVVSIQIPAQLWDIEIDPNLTAMVPIAVVWCTMTDNRAAYPRIYNRHATLIFRRGPQ